MRLPLAAALLALALHGACAICERNLMCHKLRQATLALEDACQQDPDCEEPIKLTCASQEELWTVHGCTAIDCFEVQTLGLRGTKSSREMCDFWFPYTKYSVLDTATAPKLRAGWVKQVPPDGSRPFYRNTVTGDTSPVPVT